jgi:hypothetical protein
MRIGLVFCCTALLSGYAAAAVAQTPPDGETPAARPPAVAGPSSTPTGSPATAPSASPTVPPAAPPAVPGAYRCTLGDHSGVDPDSAATAASIVCAEVAARGPQAGATYVVYLRRLGRSGVLALEQRDSAGNLVGQRQVTLQSIEETTVAAPRLADALLKGVPIEGTQRVDNLLEQETREQKRKWGATYWGPGIGGTALPGGVRLVAPTFVLAVYHETDDVAVGGDLVASKQESHNDDGKDASFTALSVGGRYFLSDGDLTPFVGGGSSWSWVSLSDGDWHGEADGFSLHAEAGIEALRMYKTRLVVGVRATLPVYRVEPERLYSWTPGSSEPTVVQQDKKYVVPVTLSATLMF